MVHMTSEASPVWLMRGSRLPYNLAALHLESAVSLPRLRSFSEVIRLLTASTQGHSIVWGKLSYSPKLPPL